MNFLKIQVFFSQIFITKIILEEYFEKRDILVDPDLHHLDNFFDIQIIESMFKNLPSPDAKLDIFYDYIENIKNYHNETKNHLDTVNNKLYKSIENNLSKPVNDENVENIDEEIKDKKPNVTTKLNNDKYLKKKYHKKRIDIAKYFKKRINNKENNDYYNILLKNLEKSPNYMKYKILFDALKFNKTNMKLSKSEFLNYIFDCSSYNIESESDIEKFNFKKKQLLFHIAKQKLKIDFDIVNILKTIDQFNDFKDVIMDEDQLRIFDFAIKKISNKNTDKNPDNAPNKPLTGKINKNIDESVKNTVEGLDEIFAEAFDGPKPIHVNILNQIGINKDIITEFENMSNLNSKSKEFLN